MDTPESDEFPTLDFYTRYYQALPRSRVYSEFCTRLYGLDLGQQGFSDMAQVQALLDAVQILPRERVLDLGCGDGRMAEHISDQTRARVVGLDLIAAAIASANHRTRSKRDRLSFVAGSIGCVEGLFPASSFDVLIAIDSLYFTELTDTIRQMKLLLRPGGRMGLFYSHGADPWHPIETFPRETLPPDAGPLAVALRANGLSYRWWDFSEGNYEHAKRQRAIIEALRPTYATDEDRFLCESRMGEAAGVMAACEAGVQVRHLFLAWE